MRLNSLAFRLFATAAVWTLLVLPIAGAIIYSLYREDVQESFDAELKKLVAAISVDSMGGDEPIARNVTMLSKTRGLQAKLRRSARVAGAADRVAGRPDRSDLLRCRGCQLSAPTAESQQRLGGALTPRQRPSGPPTGIPSPTGTTKSTS